MILVLECYINHNNNLIMVNKKPMGLKDRYNMRDSYYNYYTKEYNEPSITVTIYLEIINNFMKFLFNKVAEGFDTEMPCGLGVFKVRGRYIKPVINKDGEVKGVAPHWSKTKARWMENAEIEGITFEEYIKKPRSERPLSYCFNEHSNGIIYRINYSTSGCKLVNKSYYIMTFSRANKETVHKLIMDGKEYLLTQKIS